MKRTARLRAKKRMRRQSKKERTVVAPVWRQVKADVRERSGGRCEVTYWVPAGPVLWCAERPVDYHHVIKRSQGRLDHPDNVVALCRAHHNRTDWPYAKGRLVITARGDGRFKYQIIEAKDKFAARGGACGTRPEPC